MQSNYSLDVIRVLAMAGVLADHYIVWFDSKVLQDTGL